MHDKTEILSRIDFPAEYQKIGIQFESTTTNASAAVNLKNGFYTDLDNGG